MKNRGEIELKHQTFLTKKDYPMDFNTTRGKGNGFTKTSAISTEAGFGNWSYQMICFQTGQQYMKTKNIKIESSTSKIQQAVQKLEHFLNSNGLYERIINETTIAVSEAIANAIIHGNQNDPAKYVSVDVKINDKKLTVKVSDEGTGFSPATIPNPLNGENRMKTSGRGVYLMKATMDEVNFNQSRKGLEVELIKFLSTEHKNNV